jgi:FkbM family methyltransferase
VPHDAEKPGQDAPIEQAETRFGRMVFLRTDSILGRSLRQYGEWAQAEIDLLCDLLPADGVALDVGAYIGTHTLALARRAGAGGRVVAFEPHPAFFALLERNVTDNGLTNVSLCNFGLSDRSGVMTTSPVDPGLEGNFGGTRLDAATTAGAGAPTVRVRTLDELALARCDLIKMDVEGMEALVLAGAGRTIERHRPIVYAECNSVHAGWAVIERMLRSECDAYAFVPPAFNPDNFRGSRENFLEDAREVGLLFVPPSRRAGCAQALARHAPLAPLACLDDLALAMLRKPQYKNEVAARTRAARVLGTDFWFTSSELTAQRQRTTDLAGQLAALSDQLARTQPALDEAQKLAIGRYEELAALRQEFAALRRTWVGRLAFALQPERSHAPDADACARGGPPDSVPLSSSTSTPGAIPAFLRRVVDDRLFEREAVYTKQLSICFQPDSYADFGLHPQFQELYDHFTKGDAYRGLDIARLWSALLNLERVLESTDGSLVELGVFKGHFSAVLGWFARRHGRRLYLLDTFEGFPEGDLDGDENLAKKTAFRDTSLQAAKETVGDDPLFRWIAGAFPGSATEELLSDRFCFVSLDCDLYEPMRAGLRVFWERLVPGGMIFVHDYSSNHWPGATRALDEFLNEHAAGSVLLPDKSGTIVLTKARQALPGAEGRAT